MFPEESLTAVPPIKNSLYQRIYTLRECGLDNTESEVDIHYHRVAGGGMPDMDTFNRKLYCIFLIRCCPQMVAALE